MKLLSALISLGVGAMTASAAPTTGGSGVPKAMVHQLYRLEVSSPNSAIDGKSLHTVNSTLVLHEDQETDSAFDPARVHVIDSARGDGTYELHTYPAGVVDHVLALQAPEGSAAGRGLMSLVDIVRPSESTANEDGAGDDDTWDMFRQTESKTLTYAGQGSWTAFPRGDGVWDLKWYDGSVFVTANYMPVKVHFIEAGKASFMAMRL